MERLAICLTLLLLLPAGCRSNPYLDVYVESLNAEKRVLEDKIYALQQENQKLQEELQACRDELRQSGQGRTGPEGLRIDPGHPGPEIRPPEIDLGNPASPTSLAPPAPEVLPAPARDALPLVLLGAQLLPEGPSLRLWLLAEGPTGLPLKELRWLTVSARTEPLPADPPSWHVDPSQVVQTTYGGQPALQVDLPLDHPLPSSGPLVLHVEAVGRTGTWVAERRWDGAAQLAGDTGWTPRAAQVPQALVGQPAEVLPVPPPETAVPGPTVLRPATTGQRPQWRPER